MLRSCTITRQHHRLFFSRSLVVNAIDSKECAEIAQALQKDGFGITKSQVLTGGACDAVNLKMPALFRGDFETGIYPDEWHWRQGMSRDDVTREMCNTWKSDRFIAFIILSETIGKMVATITGWSSVRVAQDDLIWKPPSQAKTVVGFHQDGAYISDQFVPRENNSVTVWIALDDVTEDMGCLEYSIGSHLWEEKSLLEESPFHDCNPHTYRDSMPYDSEISLATLSQGQAVVHHQSVWHGSGPNRSKTKDRRALVGHYLRGDVEFKSEGTTSGPPWGTTSYIYGRYKQHGSTRLDQSFFPIVYAAAGSGSVRTPWIDDYILER